MKKNQTDNNAKASFILSLFFWIPLLNNFTAILAIVFGIVALKEFDEKTMRGKWMAIAGITIGTVTIILSIIGLIIFYVKPELFTS